MTESDWKIFKEIKQKALEKFCELSLATFREAMDDESTHIHNRYLINYKLVQNRDKQLGLLFDGQSRSKARIQLVAIRGEGLADEELIAKLSEEFRDQTNPKIPTGKMHNKAGHNRATSCAGLATLRSARLCRQRYECVGSTCIQF